MNKVYIVVKYSWSYEGGDCLDCLYSGLDKYEVCRKCLELAIKDLEVAFMFFADLYRKYKVISISDPKDFTTSRMIKKQTGAKTVAEVIGLDKALYEAVEKRTTMFRGYYVEKNDPNDILLQKQIIGYLKKVKGE